MTRFCVLVALLAAPPAGCSGSDTSASAGRASRPPDTATVRPPSASPTSRGANGKWAALNRRLAKKEDRLYRQCPNASSAPPPEDANAPVVNVGFAARGRYYKKGQVRPRCLLWSGDGDSDGVGLKWKGWGRAIATANGYGLPPEYFHRRRDVVPAQFRLGDLGMCKGVLEYRRVFERTAHSPIDHTWHHWDNGYPLCAHRDRGLAAAGSTSTSLPISAQTHAQMKAAGNSGPPSAGTLRPETCKVSGSRVTATGDIVGGAVSEDYRRYGDVVELYLFTRPKPGYPAGYQIGLLSRESVGSLDAKRWRASVPLDSSLGRPARCLVAAQPTHVSNSRRRRTDLSQ